MQALFNIENFIGEHITGRPESLLQQDFITYHHALREKIEGKSVLVIGAAGTIGSSFVKALIR
jgi:FlaA1/EpsC-like NDP-sugar epimerase